MINEGRPYLQMWRGGGVSFCNIAIVSFYPSDINQTTYIAGWQAHHHTDYAFYKSRDKNRVGDDGVPAILQYGPSDLYLTDRKETMVI